MPLGDFSSDTAVERSNTLFVINLVASKFLSHHRYSLMNNRMMILPD